MLSVNDINISHPALAIQEWSISLGLCDQRQLLHRRDIGSQSRKKWCLIVQ